METVIATLLGLIVGFVAVFAATITYEILRKK